MKKKDKIKILYVHHGTNQGGAPRSLAFLIDKLDKSKYEPYVLFFKDYEQNKELFENVGAKIVFDSKMGPWHGSLASGMSLKVFLLNIKYFIPTYFHAKKIIKNIRPDIIHLNSTCLFLIAKAAKNVNNSVPIVCHVREAVLSGFWGDILRRNNDKYVDEYVAIEEFDAKQLHTNKRVTVIYNFIDFSIYNNSIKSRVLFKDLKIPINSKIVLYLARIIPENGALELLKSLEKFLQSNKNIHFCLVGALYNRKTKYLERVLELSEKYDNVHVIPFRNDVPNLIASSNVLIVPFITPHFARSVIEAAAMGIPSIVTNVDGLKDLVIDEKTGLIYDANKTYDLENKITKILYDEQYIKNMSKSAIKYAKKNFNADVNAKRTFEIYDRLL